MRKNYKKNLFIGIGLIIGFIIWTILLCFIDLNPIGPLNSIVGFSTMNCYIHELFGSNMFLYYLTDFLSLYPLIIVLLFMILGIVQLIKFKSFLKVDHKILLLGVFYIIVFIIFILFEFIDINCRPMLIEGKLETSYPSSTTMLVICVTGTSIIHFNDYIKNNKLKKLNIFGNILFIIFMILCRMISGVHWFTDIIGALLLSIGLIEIYLFFYKKIN